MSGTYARCARPKYMDDIPEKQADNKPERAMADKPARDEAGRLLPGNTANPNGRPLKENTFSDIARTLLSSKEIHIEYTYPKDGALVKRSLNITSDNTINHSLVAALVKEGLDGNVNAIKELIDRTQGRAPQEINLGGQPNNPLSWEFVVYDGKEKTPCSNSMKSGE